MPAAKAAVAITAGAEADLHGIWRRRLAQRGTGGEDGADALLHELVARIESLADHPRRGVVTPELEAIGMRGWRQLSHPPFRIVYSVEREGKRDRVTVAVVADARRDFRTLLEERLLR